MEPFDLTSRPFEFGVSEFTTWPWTFAEDVERYARLNIRCIEVCEFKLNPDAARDELSMIADFGMRIGSVQPRLHSLFPDQPRPYPSDPDERMSLFRRSIDLFGSAAVRDATLVTITGAAPGADYRNAFAVAVDRYRRLADYAADAGVRIALEPLNPILMNFDTFICTIPDALRIVDAVDRANFGIWLDVWHFWQDPAFASHVAACGDRIFGVHVNDWHEPRCVGDRAVIGQGVMCLPDLLSAIRKTGYSGAYTLEIFSDSSLPDSLWLADLDAVITDSRDAFAAAWDKSDGKYV